MNVLIVGMGNREEALRKKVRESSLVAGVSITSVTDNLTELVRMALLHRINFVVVGPEQPLVDGIVDYFAKHAPTIAVFGPSKLAARLEGSKIFMKARC